MNNITKLADKKGITLRELAETIRVSDVRMVKIANEQAPLKPIETLNLLIFFDCKPSDLLGRSDPDGHQIEHSADH
jgi:DNA-binding Xre family transcriptional regulator